MHLLLFCYLFVFFKKNNIIIINRNANGCANNCTSTAAGTCNAATSTCACTADYQSFDCSQSKNQLERWEWALIMGGGVLVAIGLIGCIVYFIQKQQVRSNFANNFFTVSRHISKYLFCSQRRKGFERV